MTETPEPSMITAHTAEVLIHVNNEDIPSEGWCDGDAWFGSVYTCVTLKTILGVEYTFIVKKIRFYPTAATVKIPKARHGDKVAGK